MRGILTKEEIGIPYRQIQNVDIEMGPIEQALGLSRLIILTAGHEDKPDINKEESEGVLPAIDKRLAYQIREELLNKANIERVSVQN